MSYTDSKYKYPKFPLTSAYEVSPMADTTQVQVAPTATLLEKIEEVLAADAKRWENVFSHIKKIQNNHSGVSIYDFDAKLFKQIDEHVAGLRALAKLVKEPAKAAPETAGVSNRMANIELD
jgi:hypothetical protein